MSSVLHATHPPRRPALPRGFGLLIGAQFASALADNALLIVAIALLHQQGFAMWWAPLLKVGFMAAYVVLAPWVGPLADAFAKGRVMAAMNLVKIAGLALLALGLHPVAALAVVGLGAAAYAPAKYGLITELAEPEALVKANSWIEITVVSAALLGAVLGGALVSPAWLASGLADFCDGLDLPADKLTGSLAALLLIYAVSSALNAGIPDSGRRQRSESHDVGALLREFRAANRRLWRDREGGLSLAATTLFWGVGATLQFAVLRWAGVALGLPLSQAAYLQAAVAVGVIVGAAAAGRWLALHQARHGLWAGVVLGLLMPVVAQVSDVGLAALVLALVGGVGGAMVVPLNALLQHRGAVLLSAGRSIAVQGFNENLSVLAMLAAYAGCEAAGVPIGVTLSGLGTLVAASILALIGVDRLRRS
ncbi:lysophospholipid transporter LplT [Pelomonas aquatica]|jgi:LPLT family lysophospholipid transporter-like MFS transporter|uniref:lysophospholipid transporter LplT n=1 Tax=Pelomonas aquatica TaxID=431058 RepID=UPI00227D352B|nr:lysophospholipid transporter LplT [Pelomonas aquatica]MCY4757272.1 lysophospholipid transporter LplT [Pelomonas aquatica]